MSQIYLTKSITASSSSTLGSFSSGTVTTTYTSGVAATITTTGANATQLDTARRIIFWSSAAASDSLVINLTGTSESGATISETIVGSSAAGAARATTQDFASLTSVSFSSTPNVKINIGTNTQAGTAWKIFDQNIETFNFSATIAFNSTISTTLANLELTNDDPTNTVKAPARFLSTSPTLQVPFTPTTFISQTAGSTLLSTANASQTTPAFGNITTAAAAWRITLTSSSSTAGSLQATGLQLGV